MCLYLKSVSLNVEKDKLIQTITDRIKNLTGCSQFQFRVEKRDEEDDDPDQSDIDTPYMNGAQVETILVNYQTIFKDCFDEVEMMIWKFLRCILLCFICATTEELEHPEFNLDTYADILKAFSRLIRIHYSTSGFAYYVHIVIEHSADLIRKHGSLAKYSNEAVENLHCLIDQQRERGTSDGGKGSTNNYISQVMGFALRRLFLMVIYSIKWDNEVGSVVLQNKQQKAQKKLQRLISYINEVKPLLEGLNKGAFDNEYITEFVKKYSMRPGPEIAKPAAIDNSKMAICEEQYEN
jgi:hypothetical protein